MNSQRPLKKTVARKLIYSLMLLVVLALAWEVFLHVLLDAKPVWAQQMYDQWRLDARADDKTAKTMLFFADRKATRAMWREHFRARDMAYVPYVLHRRKPFEGEYINVGQDHNRVTVNPKPVPGHRKVRIWFFGGSTMWGIGAEGDWATIPSLTVKQLHRRNPSVNWEAVNFGESGFASTTELLQLTLELRNGRPDVVVFLDGVNDVLAASWNGFAGVEINHFVNRHLLEHRLDPDDSISKTIYLLRKAQVIESRRLRMGRLGLIEAHRPRDEAPFADPTPLAGQTREHLIRNWQVASDLVRARGGKFLAVLQAHALSGAYGRNFEGHRGDQYSRKFYHVMYAQVQKSVPVGLNFLDLSDVMPTKRLVFFDFCHTNSVGHDHIVKRLAPRIQQMIGRAEASSRG